MKLGFSFNLLIIILILQFFMQKIKKYNEQESLHYRDFIQIKETEATSTNSEVLFGQDTHTGIELIIKQQNGGSLKSLYWELSILMLIEEVRHDTVRAIPT